MRFKFLNNVKFNGIHYTAGQEAELADDKGTALLVDGGLAKRIEPVKAEPKEKPKKTRRTKK